MKVVTLEDFCEAQGLPYSAVGELVEVLQEREVFSLAKVNMEMGRRGSRPYRGREALPLTDGGDEFGRVEARIPKTLFFNLLGQKRFGWEGLTSDEGLKDVLRDFPQCRVETVSGKIVSGYTGPSRTIVKKY